MSIYIINLKNTIKKFFEEASARISMVSTAKKAITLALIVGMITVGIFGRIRTAEAAKTGSFKLTYWTFEEKKGSVHMDSHVIDTKKANDSSNKTVVTENDGTWTRVTSTVYYTPSDLNLKDADISTGLKETLPGQGYSIPQKVGDYIKDLKSKHSDIKLYTNSKGKDSGEIVGNKDGDGGYGTIASADNTDDPAQIDDNNGNSSLDNDTGDQAEDKEITIDNIKKDPDSYVLENIVRDMFSMTVVNPFGGEEIKFFDLGNSAKSILTFSQVSDLKPDGSSALTAIAKKINNGVQNVALSLLVLFTALELLSMAARETERISFTRVMMLFLKESIWGGIALSSWSMSKAFLSMGDVVTSVVTGATKAEELSGDATGVGDDVAVFIANQSALYKAFTFIIALILWVITIGTAIAVLTFVISRVLRILIYMALAPIPLVLCANEETSHTGMRFMMNLFALGLEAAIIMLLCNFYIMGVSGIVTAAGSDKIGTMMKFLLGMIMMNSMLAGSIQASTGMSREFIGM